MQSTALYTPKMPPLGSQYATFGIPKGHLSAMKVPLLSTKTTKIIAQKSTDVYNHLTIRTLRLHTFFCVIYEKSVGIFIQRSIEGLRKYKKKAQTTHHVAICQKAREYGVALDYRYVYGAKITILNIKNAASPLLVFIKITI